MAPQLLAQAGGLSGFSFTSEGALKNRHCSYVQELGLLLSSCVLGLA